MALDPVLAKIPGLAGYLAQDSYSRGQESEEAQKIGLVAQLREKIMAQNSRRLEQEYMAKPEVQAQLQAGNMSGVLSGAPGMNLDRALKLGELNRKSAGSFTTAGDGILNTADGSLRENPYAKEAKGQNPSNVARLIAERDRLPPESPLRGTYDNAIRKESETAKQISPTIVNNNPQPVTPVTIADPADPTGRNTIIIDGRTKQVLGKGPRMTQAGAIDAKTELSMQGLGKDLQMAEDLMMGVTRTSDGQVVKGNKPTGSGLGSLYDSAAGFVGLSPAGAEEASSLSTVAARLVSRIPRFEGPQSDKDVAEYKKAAGDAGNDKIPIAKRLAAIRTMRQIYAGYETGQKGRLVTSDRRATTPPGPQPTVVDW